MAGVGMLGTEQLRRYLYVGVSNAGSLQNYIPDQIFLLLSHVFINLLLPFLHELVAGEQIHLLRLVTDRGQAELLHHDLKRTTLRLAVDCLV